MKVKELAGKRIMDIYQNTTLETGGLEHGECFVKLDNGLLIDIPFDGDQDILTKTLPNNALSLFSDLSDVPVAHVNSDKKTIGEITGNYQLQKQKTANRLRTFLFGIAPQIKEYQPHHLEYKENKLKNIKGKLIIDFLWYPDEAEKGYLLLDSGYLITEITVAPHGTGLAGLNYFENLTDLTDQKGTACLRLTEMGVI